MAPGPHAGNRNRPAYSGQPRFRFPKQIIQLFAARKQLEFKPPPRKRRLRPMTGLAEFVDKFKTVGQAQSSPKDVNMSDKSASKEANDTTSNNVQMTSSTTSEVIEGKTTALVRAGEDAFETPAQRRRRLQMEKKRYVAKVVKEAREKWRSDEVDNSNSVDEKMTGNQKGNKETEKTKEPYSTLFIWNLPFTAVPLRLRDEFEAFGPVRTVIIPEDRDGVPRGYAFVEFEHERDADVAVRQADGLRFDGRRLKVDVERGRTVKGWLPNRLDGPFNSCAAKRD